MRSAQLFSRLALRVSCLALPAMAAAQAMDFVQLSPLQGASSQVTIGRGAASVPEFSGADEQRTMALPLLDARWANGWFASTCNGVGFNFWRDPRFDFGLRLSADFGRDSGRSPQLRGYRAHRPE